METKGGGKQEGFPEEMMYKLKSEKQARVIPLKDEKERERVLKAERTAIYPHCLFYR